MRVLNRRPGNVGAVASAAMPFVLALVVYVAASGVRLAENPDDKLLPSLATIGDAIERVAFTPDRRTGDYILWTDTAASLQRLLIGVAVAAVVGLAVGVPNGLLPWFGAFWSPWVRAMSMIPPLAILPILFIVFGIGELAKVMLIVLGTAPFLMRDIEQRVRELPREQLVKAQTLDGTTWQIAVRVVLPQVLPRLVDGVRLSLGSAWLFLIAGGGHRLDGWLGLPDFPCAPVPVDGRDSALRGLDHLACVSAGLRVASAEPTLLPVVRSLT